MSNQQFLVDAILVRSKRGPYNKIPRMQRLKKIQELYFEKELSITNISSSMGIHRNTISSDVEYLRNEFLENVGENEMIDFYYRKKSVFARQRQRLEEKIKNDSNNQYKLEKLLLDLAEKEFKLFSQFRPTGKKFKIGKKLVKKVIRKLAFARFAFLMPNDLIREIILQEKCDVYTAHLIIIEMESLGLNHAKFLGSEVISLVELGKLCGYLSEEEISRINLEKTQKEEKEKREYEESLSELNKEFEDKFGDSKDWSAEVKEKYKTDISDWANLYDKVYFESSLKWYYEFRSRR